MKSIVSLQFVITRMTSTRTMQTGLAADPGWVWPEKSLDDWSTDETELAALGKAQVEALIDLQFATGEWDDHLARVTEHTRTVVGLGRIRFRKQPAAAALFRSLRTNAKSRATALAQAQAAHDAWAETDAAWTPDEGFTLAGFATAIETLGNLKTAHDRKETAWKAAGHALMSKAVAVDADCVAWYAEAARRFPAGTGKGDAIRETVPTTYRRARKVGAVTLSATVAEDGAARLELAAAGATKFAVWQRSVGAEAWQLVTDAAKPGRLEARNLPPGPHEFKAQGRNARRKGEMSAPVAVVIAAAAAGNQ